MKSFVAVLGLFVAVALAHPLHDDKRRAMSSWSGWMPGSGMTLFSAGEDRWGMQPPPIWRMDEEGLARPVEDETPQQPPPTRSQPPKKRGHEEEEEDDEEDTRYGGSKANASFNAWFPIVLGYPGEDGSSRARGEWKNADERGVAAVANSVNHGKSGVASSHAIIYSGEPPSRRKASNDVTRQAE